MTSRSRIRRLAAVLLAVTVAASIFLAAPGGAEEAPGTPAGVRVPDQPEGSTAGDDPIDPGAATPADPPPGETVRVVVELETPVVPEAELSERAAEQQRDEIDDDAEEVAESLEGTDAEVVNDFETLPAVVVEADAEALDRLAASPDVASVTVDGEAEPLLDNSIPQVRADAAWTGGDGTGQQVAILDTGVQADHPHLNGKVVYEACFAQDSIPDNDPGEGDCPNNQPTQDGTGAGAPCQDGNCDHGTHVAAIAASQDGTYPGVAKGAAVVSVRVFHDNGGLATAFFSDITAGLDHLSTKVNDGTLLELAAANLSLGASTHSGFCNGVSPSMTTAIKNLKDLGVATVAASGNNGQTDELSFPACIRSAISVGSVTTTESGPADQVWGSSNASKHLDLLAPGRLIDAASAGSQGTEKKTGTSMAAPHVAGAFAVLRHHGQTPPGGLDVDVVDHLHGLLRTSSNGSDCVTDGGNGRAYRRLDVKDAVDWDDPPSARYSDVEACSSNEDAIDWVSHDPDGSGGPLSAVAPGYRNGTFRRDAVVRKVKLAQMAFRLFGSVPIGHQHQFFTDVPPGGVAAVRWANDPHGPAAPYRALNGNTKTRKFSSNQKSTRGQVTRMLYRLAGRPTPSCASHGFSDVPRGLSRATRWISCRADGPGGTLRIANGYPSGKFRHDKVVSRVQVARALFRFDQAGYVT